ncbi:hypothetical protein C1H46_017291 [Malus baccata]|uniref:Uncharacterized protein n=1 Tax=Malus baccata TaxID=106549 RepID=A0A540MF44_MALBA|nr:hypothetical protein C1H46_017291 [Malus baccata]
MFNENLKTGPTSERNFGLFQANGSIAYDIVFRGISLPGDVEPANDVFFVEDGHAVASSLIPSSADALLFFFKGKCFLTSPLTKYRSSKLVLVATLFATDLRCCTASAFKMMVEQTRQQ